MVISARKLENSLGDGQKKIEENEKTTSIIQRRSLRASALILKGTRLRKEHLIALRPCPKDGILPNNLKKY